MADRQFQIHAGFKRALTLNPTGPGGEPATVEGPGQIIVMTVNGEAPAIDPANIVGPPDDQSNGQPYYRGGAGSGLVVGDVVAGEVRADADLNPDAEKFIGFSFEYRVIAVEAVDLGGGEGSEVADA